MMTGAPGRSGAVATGLVGLISVWRVRRAGRQARRADPEADRRMAARMEMERRMASCLAARGSEPLPEADEQRRSER